MGNARTLLCSKLIIIRLCTRPTVCCFLLIRWFTDGAQVPKRAAATHFVWCNVVTLLCSFVVPYFTQVQNVRAARCCRHARARVGASLLAAIGCDTYGGSPVHASRFSGTSIASSGVLLNIARVVRTLVAGTSLIINVRLRAAITGADRARPHQAFPLKQLNQFRESSEASIRCQRESTQQIWTA